MSLSYRFALQDDLSKIVDLVNAAYRGEDDYLGWTHEGHLLEGERISLQQLAQQLSYPNVKMLLAESEGELQGCMMLSQKAHQLYLGTFAVIPCLQGNGIGRQMLQQAEWLAAEQWQASEIEMVVILQRQDLIDYYQRRGYQVSGDISDFPVELDVGVPKIEGLTIVALRKQL